VSTRAGGRPPGDDRAGRAAGAPRRRPPALSPGDGRVQDALALLVGWLITLFELIIAGTAVLYIAFGTVRTLLVWEACVAVYLIVGFVRASRAADARRQRDRVGALGVLSSALPILASLTGVFSAIVALVALGASTGSAQDDFPLAAAATFGMVLSWLMLHTGMAQVYRSLYWRDLRHPSLEFPNTRRPSLLDFAYFSFGVGATFATSDTTVLTRAMRRTVLLHSILAFFYNAFVIAVAFQVLQQIITA
jgi:uncharacterized membrane protein